VLGFAAVSAITAVSAIISEIDATGHADALETPLLLSSDVIAADVELDQRPLVTDRDISDNRDAEILFYIPLTFDGINTAMMMASSTPNPLPEKSSSALDLMSWIGRGKVWTTTVDMAPLSCGYREIIVVE
jgi:hypothetical protein